MGVYERLYKKEKKETKGVYDRFVENNPERAERLFSPSQMPTYAAVKRTETDNTDYQNLRMKALELFNDLPAVPNREIKTSVEPISTEQRIAPHASVRNNRFLQENKSTPSAYRAASEKASPISYRAEDRIALDLTGKYSDRKKAEIENALNPGQIERDAARYEYFKDKDVAEKPASTMTDEEKKAVVEEYESIPERNVIQRLANQYARAGADLDLFTLPEDFGDYGAEYARKQELYPNYREIKNEEAYKALIDHGMTVDDIELINGSPVDEDDAILLRLQGKTDAEIEEIADQRNTAQVAARTKLDNLINSIDESWGVSKDDIVNMVEDRYANPEIEKEATRRPVSNSVYSLLSNPAESAFSVGANVVNYATGKPMKDYNTTTDLIRNTVTQNIDNQIGRTIYGGAMSIGDMAVALGTAYATGGGSIVSAGIQALEKASQVMDKGIERNLNPDEIFAEGIASGITTYVTEKLTMSRIEEIANRGLTEYSKKEIGKTLGAMFLKEGLQEVYEDLADWSMDWAITWDNNEFNSDVQRYVDQGVSRRDAVLKVIVDRFKEITTSFVVGGIGGMLMGGAASGLAYATGKVNNKPSVMTDKVMNSPDALNKLLEAGKTLDSTNLTGEDAARVEHAKEVSNKPVDQVTKEDIVDVANVLNEQANAQNNYAETINEINYEAGVDENLENYRQTGEFVKNENELDIEKAARQGAESLVVQYRQNQREEQRQREKQTRDELRDYKINGLKSKIGETMVEFSKDFENETAAKTFLDNYKGQSPDLYSQVSFEAYYAGESGQSFETFMNNSIAADIMVKRNLVTESYLKTLFYQGQNARTEENEEIVLKKNENRGLATGITEDDKLAEFKQKVAEKLGIEVATDLTDAVERGNFSAALAKITVNATSDNQYAALVHEMFEFARAYNPKGMQIAENTLVNMIVNKSSESQFVDAVNRYKEVYREQGRKAPQGSSLANEANKTFAGAQEEFINDAISYVFSSEEGMNTLVNYIMDDSQTSQEEKVSAIQTIKDWVDHLIQTIKNFISGNRTKQLGYEYAKEAGFNSEELEAISRMLTGVLDDARTNLAKMSESTGKVESEKVAHSVEVEYEKSVDEGLLKYVNNFNSDIQVKNYYIVENELSEKLTDAISELVGFSVKGYKEILPKNSLRHIEKRHGKNGIADTSMENPEDIARMNYAINNYDRIKLSDEVSDAYKNKDNTPSKTIQLVKKIGENYYYVVEAVPDSTLKSLIVLTAYRNENDTFDRVPDANESLMTNGQTAHEHDVSFTDSSISNNVQKINTQDVGDKAHSLNVPVEEAAKKHFGTTDDFRVAGYLLTDGTMLDFSGAHWLEGESPEYIAKWKKQNDIRQVDHEDIYEVMEASGDNRKQFMDRGNIRLSPEAPGFNISSKAEPTAAQYRMLKEFIREVKNNPNKYDANRFFVDIETDKPNKITYENNLNEDRIINDIKSYFETGKMPEQSTIDKFRYSLSVPATDSEGRALSEGQQNLFKNDDRNLFNDKGELKRYFHGTQRAGFTVFERSDDGISYFFTDNKKVATTYSGVNIFENPDTPMTVDQINDSLWQVTGTDEEDMLFKEVNGRVEFWEDDELKQTFDSVKDAQDWFVDEYISTLIDNDMANPSNYEVYLYATNPIVVDAKGENWNHLPPLKPFKRHLSNVELEWSKNGTIIEYDEDGKHKTDSAANYEYLDDFFNAYGIDIDEQTKLFDGDYYHIKDMYFDEAGKRMEQYAKTRDYSQYAYENGYDSVIFNNIADNGFFGGFNNKETSQVVVVFDSSQAKSIYNLNPTDSKDIRHSFDVQDDSFFESFRDIDEKVKLDESELSKLLNEKMDLDSDVAEKAVREVASRIKKQYNSNVKLDRLAGDIMSVFKYLKSTGNMSMKDVMFVMSDIAKPVLEDIKPSDPEQEKRYKDFIKKIKTYRIALDAGQTAEVAHAFDSYYNFQRAMRGKINFAKDGTPLDNIWTEICDMSDGALSYGTNPNDQPLALAEYVNSLTPSYQTMGGETIDDAATDLALEIFRQFYVYQSMNDAAAKVKGELTRRSNKYKQQYKEKYNEALKQVEKEKAINLKRLADEIENLTAEEQEAIRTGDAVNQAVIENLKRDYQKRYDNLRKQTNSKIVQIKAQYQNAWINKNLSRERTELKNRVLREVKALQNMIAHPAEGATKHVPINLINPTIEMLEAINLDNGGRNKTIAERLKKMSEVYESFKNDDRYSFDYDERIANDIEELREIFDKKSYADLQIDELERVIEIVQALKTQIKNANNLILQGKLKDAQKEASTAMKEVNESRRHDNAAMNALNRYGNIHLNAYRLFRKLSGYKDGALMEIYRDLDEGSKKEMQIQKDLGEIFQSVLEGKTNQKEIKKFISTKKEDLVDIGITDKNGKPILITKAMRMSLIMHSMNAGNMRHVLGSGITVPNMYYFEKGKLDEAYAKGTNYRFVDYNELLEALQKNDVNKVKELTTAAQERIEKMKDDLSDWEKDFLAAAEEMFHEKTGEYINDTSMALKGYALARVKNYFPIKTDSHFTTQDWSGLIQNGSLEGSGFLKERVVSTKPILLEDITNVIQRQIRSVSKYAGLAIPVRNFETVMKQISRNQSDGQLHNLYETIDKVWGASDTKWLQNLMQDIQGGRRESDSAIANFFTKLRGNFAAATLNMNLGVAIKQAASYPTAAAVTGWKPLLRNIPKLINGFRGKGIAELEAINPLLWYREQGYGTQDLADAKSSDIMKNLSPNVQKALGWTQMFDTATVRTLEYVAKDYVDHNFKSLEEGSEEYWQKVSDVFTSIVEETQPNYSKLQQADVIRNPNAISKMLVMFKTQPMQNFGIIYDAMGELNAAVKSGDKAWTKEATSKVARAVSSQVVSASIFSVMTMIGNILRHRTDRYKDEEGEWSIEQILKEFATSFASCLVGGFIGGSVIYEGVKFLIEKLIQKKGARYYGLEVSAVEVVNDIVTNAGKVASAASAVINDKTTAGKEEATKKSLDATLTLAETVGEYIGVPVRNMKQLMLSMAYYAIDAVSGIKNGDFKVSNDRDIFDNWEIPSQYERIFEATINGDTEEAERLTKQLVNQMKKDKKEELKSGELTEDAIIEAVNNNILDKYKDIIRTDLKEGDISAEEAEDYLVEIGKDKNEAYSQVKKWEAGSNSEYTVMNDTVAIAAEDPTPENRKAVIDEVQGLIEHGKTKKGVHDSLSRAYKEKYIELYKQGKAADLNAILRTALVAAGFTDEEAKKKLSDWVK